MESYDYERVKISIVILATKSDFTLKYLFSSVCFLLLNWSMIWFLTVLLDCCWIMY